MAECWGLGKVDKVTAYYLCSKQHPNFQIIKGAETILYTYKYWPFSDMFDNCFSSHGLPILTIVKSSNSQNFVSNFVFLSLAYKYENLVTVIMMCAKLCVRAFSCVAFVAVVS